MTDLEKYLEKRYEEIDRRYCMATLSVKRIDEKYTALREAANKALIELTGELTDPKSAYRILRKALYDSGNRD
jgi:hypothetical protein